MRLLVAERIVNLLLILQFFYVDGFKDLIADATKQEAV